MQKMQMSSFSPKAKEFVSVIPTDCRQMGSASGINWYDKLKEWSFEYLKDKTEPVFLRSTWNIFGWIHLMKYIQNLMKWQYPFQKIGYCIKTFWMTRWMKYLISKNIHDRKCWQYSKIGFFKSIREIDSLMTAWKIWIGVITIPCIFITLHEFPLCQRIISPQMVVLMPSMQKAILSGQAGEWSYIKKPCWSLRCLSRWSIRKSF